MFKEILANGSLRTKAILGRIGVQEYDGVGVLRPVDEVKQSAEGFKGLTVTFVHPDKATVDLENIKETAVGTVLDSYYQDETGLVIGDLVIFDPTVIDKVLSDQFFVSLGYSCYLKPETGVWQDVNNLSRTNVVDQPYVYKQTAIKPNHVAIVDNPRAGTIAKIFTDESVNTENKYIFKETQTLNLSMDTNEILSKLLVSMDAIASRVNEMDAKMDSKMQDMSSKLEDVSAKEEITQVSDSNDKPSDIASILNTFISAKVIDSAFSECKSTRDVNLQLAKNLLPSITVTDSMSDDFIAGLIAAKIELEGKENTNNTSMSKALNNQKKQVVDSNDDWNFEFKRGA
jgi:hypothetical protein